jgi:hypothetical protein
MYRHTNLLQIVLFGIGVVLIFVSAELERYEFFILSAIPFGLAFLLTGLRVVRYRQDRTYENESGIETTYSGMAAVLCGLISILSGLVLIFVGLLPLFNLQDAAVSFVSDTPGVLLMFIGLIVTLNLLPQLFGSDQFRRRGVLSKTVERLFIAIWLVIAICATIIGYLQFTDPPAAVTFVEGIVTLLPDDIQAVVEGFDLEGLLNPPEETASEPQPPLE